MELQKFIAVYTDLTKDNLPSLNEIYADDVVFKDPAHEVKGLDNLLTYFFCLYENINEVNYTFINTVLSNETAYIEWRMTFSHPKIAGGKKISVPGASRLTFDDEGKVSYHRDYFDLGVMVYENIPMLGRLVKHIKRRIGR